MKTTLKTVLKNTLLFLLLLPAAVHAANALRMPGLFMDHMVLQRDKPIPVWGNAQPGEEISVEFSGQKKTAKADASGKWMVKLDPLPASAEPHELVVESKAGGQKSTFTDVLIGDVWLCSGQSNMWFPVKDVKDGQKEAAAANDPQLRLFVVEGKWSLEPVPDTKGLHGGWQPCTPPCADWFCASGYFFGRQLRRELGIPVGLIQCSWCGTPAEAWTRLEALQAVPVLSKRVDQEIAQYRSQEEDNKKFVIARAEWEEKYGVKPGPVSDAARGWADPALETSDWKPVTLPTPWAKFGAKSGGVFWIRKEVTLPASAAGKPFTLSLSWAGEQYDTAYFNGVEVGHNPDKPPGFYNGGRSYQIPGKLVKEGRNVIAVRVTSATQNAQFGPPGYAMGLPVADKRSVDSNWLMKTETAFPPLPPEAGASRPKPNSIVIQHVPSSLFNGMISPMMPFAFKGVIWYQGEDSAGRPLEYRELLSAMIRDWRAQWSLRAMGEPEGSKKGQTLSNAKGQGAKGQSDQKGQTLSTKSRSEKGVGQKGQTLSADSGQDFPFLIQQLVNYGLPTEDPNKPGSWALMREAQTQVAESLPASGLSIGIDIGEALDIHPKNKQDVGRRLGLVALEKVYGKEIESSGPRFASMKIEGAAIRVSLSHAKGLCSKDGAPKGFAIAGADKKFVWAEAKIDPSTSSGQDGTIIVSSPQVPQPVAVRYAFASNPAGCNIYNAAGLPMAPFRTDDWK